MEKKKLHPRYVRRPSGVSSRRRRLRLAVVLVATLVLGSTLSASPQHQPTIERTWYRIDIADAPAGWMSETESRTAETSTFESTMEITIRRGDDQQTLQLESGFTESSEGTPIEAWAIQTFGANAPTESRYSFLDDQIEVRSRSGDGPFTTTSLPNPPAGWITPSNVQHELEKHLVGSGESFSIRTFDPLLGAQPVETLWEPTSLQTTIDILGVTHPCRRWHQSQEAIAPGVITEVDVDEHGSILRSRTAFLGMALTMTKWPQRPLLPTSRPPELLRQTFIRPDKPISRPRELVGARYSIDLDRRAAATIPTSGSQSTELTTTGVHITVDLERAQEEAPPADLESYLRPSLYLDFESPAVEALRVEAVGHHDSKDRPNARARALRLRQFVNQHLSDKDLTTILATASEVAESRTGDCTEHSILLAALLRADDIPARVVTGVVYIGSFVGENDIFGYHMWTQAWIGDRWHDLDASFSTVFDATHIALGYARLNDDSQALLELARLADLTNGALVQVLETRYR